MFGTRVRLLGLVLASISVISTVGNAGSVLNSNDQSDGYDEGVVRGEASMEIDGELIFIKKVHADPDGEMDGYFDDIEYGSVYLRPIVYVSDGDYIDPYSSAEAFARASSFSLINGFDIRKLMGNEDNCLESNDFVLTFGNNSHYNFYEAKNGGSSIYESEDYSLVVERGYDILSNKSLEDISVSVEIDYDSVARKILEDLNITSHNNYKTTLQLHETYNSLIGTYLQYVVNEDGDLVAKQGVISYQDDHPVIIENNEFSLFNILYVGDLDKDQKPDFIFETEYFKPGGERSRFVIVEKRVDEWVVEKVIGPFRCWPLY